MQADGLHAIGIKEITALIDLIEADGSLSALERIQIAHRRSVIEPACGDGKIGRRIVEPVVVSNPSRLLPVIAVEDALPTYIDKTFRRNHGSVILEQVVHVYPTGNATHRTIRGILPDGIRSRVRIHRIVLRHPLIRIDRADSLDKPVSAGINHRVIAGRCNHVTERIGNCRQLIRRQPLMDLRLDINGHRKRNRIILHQTHHQLCFRPGLIDTCCIRIPIGTRPDAHSRRTI